MTTICGPRRGQWFPCWVVLISICVPKVVYGFMSPFRSHQMTFRQGITHVYQSSFYQTPSDDEDFDDEDEDIDDEEDTEDEDPYKEMASSEFEEDSSSLAYSNVDWGGALGSLRDRIGDFETGRAGTVSNALFRTMTRKTPNEAIGSFINGANPEVVAAMSSAVNTLLGGLSNPSMGVETIVKASGEKIGALCFQLQMTGYMFRNAEYVIALKEILKIQGKATVAEYKEAFDQLDTDQSGFIETTEIENLLAEVYDGNIPAYEVGAFMNFFDSNNDGRISWKEFEKGLGAMTASTAANAIGRRRLSGATIDDAEDDDDSILGMDEPLVSGKVKIELKNGKVIEVEAKDYINDLKKEAQELQEALNKERGLTNGRNSANNPMSPPNSMGMGGPPQGAGPSAEASILGYVGSLGGDVRSLTEGISPDVVDAMQMLVEFVLDGGAGGRPMDKKKKKSKEERDKLEMELPGSALQQLALWQLVLGYRLREMEATGEYRKLLE